MKGRTKVSCDITEVQPGDVFVEAPELGEFVKRGPVIPDAQGNPNRVKVWTTDADMDRWGCPQTVEVWRKP